MNVIRLRNCSRPRRGCRARKWRQAVTAVDWLAAQLPRDAKFQVYAFNTRAWPLLPGTQGIWLDVKDGAALDKAIATLRQTVPEGGTSLANAFAAARAMNPAPDNIILLTDGLPTQGAVAAARARPSRDASGCSHFDAALEQLPRGVPVNTVLCRWKATRIATSAFWTLAMASRGSFMMPSRDWP